MARLHANLAAIEIVQALRAEFRAATPAEQEILAGWSGWGAVSAVFEEKPGEDRAFTQGRQQLRTLLTDKEYAAARRDTINAHYTGTALAQAMWDGLAAFGFTGGRVLEPGCGSGNFIGLAPLGTAMAGIEMDPVTAHVAAALYPHAQIRNESFADTQLPEGSFDAAIGNVPFGKIHLNDSRYNPGRQHPIHTHFVLKAAALVRPGGWIALITSRYTLDGTGEDAVAGRRQLAGLGELAAAVRLPAVAHRRTAGTDVVTDVLVIRRFEDGEQPPPGEPAWIQTVPVDVDGVQIPVNQYFADHPGMVLGDLAAGGARRPLLVIAPAGADVAGGLAISLARAAASRAAPAPRPATAAAGTGRPPEGFQHARPDGTFTRITDGIAEPFDPPGGRAGQAELRALLGMRDAAMALLDAELATTEDSGLVDDLRADLNARYDAYVAAYGPVNRHTRQVKIRNTPEGRALRGQLLAEGDAQFTGGKLEISDLAVRDRLVADGHATVTGTGELRFGRTRAARAERQRLLDSGQARALGGTLTLAETGRARLLENAADLQDAVTIIRVRPSQGGFRNDPFAVRVPALEKYDPETGIARKNDILRHRVLLPRPDVEHAENPEEALAICMDRHARVRLDVIAALLGAASEQDARDRLGTLVYHDPAEGRLVAAQEYLSGDVRAKLRQAAAAAADDPGYQGNVEALTEVIPPDLGPAEIEARLGAVFIAPAQVQQFLREILADEAVTVTLAANGTWSVSGGDRHSVAATLTWGTKDRDTQALAEHLLNRKGPVEVTRKNSDGTTWTDEEATQAAREKQAELSDRFAGWAWEDLDRAGEICRRYNDAFNSIVLRSYDEVRLSLPGVNRDISLFWWQKAAIARMIYEPTAGLFHDMGAGKTLEQIIGVMEQKRLGLIRKPVICVKNHLLDQFRDEFLWAFPQARILCADTDDLAGEGRRQFIARCAAENPDAIIMTRGAFESIPLTPEGHEAYLDYMKEMFAVHAADVTESVKDEETLLAEFEERLRAYFDPDYQKDEDEDQDQPGRKRRKVEQDPAMCWEQMGIDYVCVDESQDFNNLWVPSDEPGMAVAFVHRSIDLEMKLHAIRRRYGSRAGALATGTPVTNKISQFYVLQRYLRPERLQAAGFAGYAPWAATYTEPEQRLEMKADGRFGMVTRMRLINFPELLLDLHYFGDFKDADDIGLPRPAIRGGKPEIRGNPAVTELVDYQSTLPDRYDKAKGGRKEKGDDTVVAVIGDGFRAAQDLRLVKAKHGVKPRLTDEPQKIDYIADDVYAEWLKHRDEVYPGEDGQPDPVTGSLQLVFCNEGVPRDNWNLYDELRNLLIERGMPRAAIRFIHNAGDARKKAALFAACNAGHVGVLIGSTEKMGVGTNVQRRCIGIHHVHPHWRPDYDAQEDARARRPGNLNTEVFIKKWITEGSFDTIRAQACERKSVFLRVIKHRDTSVRSIEAPGDDTVSYAEIAAVGAGEPRLIQKAQLESELQQLARAQRRHLNNQNALKVAEQQARASVTAAEQTIRDVDTAAGRVVPTAGDAFSMTVDGTTFTARREAGDHLITCLREARARVPAGECHTRTVGTIGGFQVTADLAHDGREDIIVVRLADLPGGAVKLNHRKLPAGIGLVNRLENRLTGLDKLRLEQEAILDRQRQEITRAQSAIGTPFPQQDALVAAKNALDVLVTELRGDKDDKKADPATTASGPAGPRHDDNRDIRPAAETRPTHAGGHANTNTSQAPGRAAEADGPSSTAPAAAAHGTSHGTGTDWISGHPFSADIGTLRQAAQADSTLTQQARVNGLDRFLLVFRPWADDHVARTGTSPDSPLPLFAAAYLDDPVFAADLTGTLAARIRQSLTGPPGLGDPSPDADATAEAARAVKASIESKLRDACPCGSGCGRCRLPNDRDPDLAEAVRISIRLSRAGMPRQQRVIAWDQASASYGIEYPVPDGGTYRLPVPPEGKQIRISHPDGSATVTSRTRGDPDATEWAAAAYAEATRHQTDASLAHRAGTPAGPGLEGAARAGSPEDTMTQQAAVSASGPPAGQAVATAERAAANSPAPTAAHGRPASQDQDEDQAAAPEPADDPAAGLVIEHHQQGTLVHGTEKNDQQLRRVLHEQGFRWSGNLKAWYLPRPWTFSTRDHRVTGLTASLRQARRSFTMRNQPSAPGAVDDSPPKPVPAGEPYTELRQAQGDHSAAVYDYWELTRTPAGNNVMSTRQPGARPDAAALDAAYHAVHASWHQAFAGDPHEVADRFTAWMQAASTLSRHLAAEQHRAPKFRQTLDDFIRSATRLASRTQATAEDPTAWARVFAGIPGNAPDTNPHPKAITPDPAQSAAGSPKPGAAPAGNEQARQDSDEPGRTPAPAGDPARAGAPPDAAAPAALGSDPARLGTTASQGLTGHEPGTPGEAPAGRQQPGAETSAQDDPTQQAGTVTPGQDAPDGVVEPVPATPDSHYETAGHSGSAPGDGAPSGEEPTASAARQPSTVTLRGQPPAPAADGSAPEPVLTGDANGEPGTQARETSSPPEGTQTAPAATEAAAGARASQSPDDPGADRGLSRLPPGTQVRARPGRSEHEEVITLISGPRSFHRDLPATYVGETAGGQRCSVDPARITAILGTAPPAAHGEIPRTANKGRDTAQDQATLPGSPQDPDAGSAANPAVAPAGSASADPAGSSTAAIWPAPQDAARLADAGSCTYYVHRAAGGAGSTRCVITAVPPRTAAGYLSVTPGGTWTETWRGQDHPLGPGAVPGPDYPITLSEARALAAAARLEVHITRAAGRAYVSLAEPGAASTPALSFEYGSREVFAGRHITTASRAITWLNTYRETADEWAAAHGGDIFTATDAIPGWKGRIAHLVPHIPPGPDHERAVTEHLTAATRLARSGQHAEAEQALRRAEAASPALVLAPAREAALTEKIETDAAGYAWTGTPARYIAEIMHATPPEWDWIDRRIAASPGIYTQHTASARQPAPAAAQDNTAAARNLASQAKAAYDQGHYGQALALADDAEICDPVQQHRYEQIRQVITTAAAAQPATPIPGDSASSPAGPQLEPGESLVQATAAEPPPGQPVPGLPELPPPPAASPGESVDSWSLKSMKDYTAAQDGLAAWQLADEAGRLQRAGASHQDVMMALAGAENVAPEADRPLHAARLDSYAAAYGLRGWYRGTGRDRDGRDGQPQVHTNKIRTAADGNHGRYFYHGHSAISGPDYNVIDRDTGQRAAHCATREEADAWIEHAEKPTGPATSADAAPAIPPNGTGDEAAATAGEETGAIAPAAAPAAPATPPMHGPAGPPDGIQPVTAHTEWGGPLRPERLLHADGTPLTVRGQGEDGDQVLQATAVGAAPAPAGSDHAPGRLQVVQWDTGGYGIVHPALASHRGIDPYSGLSDRDRARWEAFDLAEAWPTNVAGLTPHLVDPGDILQVGRRPQSRVMDLYEIRSIQPGTGHYAGGLEFKVKGRRSPLYYPDRSTVAVGIPAQHPSLAAAIRAAATAGPRQGETAAPAAGEPPAARPAAGAPDAATRGTAPGQDPPGAADDVHPGGRGQYSIRIRISEAPGRPTVSGTSYADDPPELREALRDNGFTWRKQRKVWEYTGRDTSRQKSVTAIRELLTRLDRDAAPGGGKTFPPTPQQQAILDACTQGKNVAVQALAGTGKTTTLVLVARALMDRSPGTRISYTAFNADIVADARRGRFGRNVTAMTMHSIAKQALQGTSYAAKITDGGQGARWPEQWAEVLGIPALTATGSDPVPAEAVARLVIATVKKFRESADDQPERQHLPGHLTGAAQSPLAKAVLSYARNAWADITDTGNAALLATGRALRVDHDDYLKVWALCRPQIGADVIFFDEAQDVNAVMRQVILDQPTQTIVVGDSHQSIYGFRGAIDALKDWPADVVLPLTQSWRFGPEAAEFGNLFLQSLGSELLLEGNPALDTQLNRADDPDAILCRTNATAVAEVFSGLESGKRTALAGGGQAIKDIAKAARDLQAGRGTKHPDLSRFSDWDEVRAYAEHEEDGKNLQVLVRLVDRHGPEGLIDMISRLTPEGDAKNPPQLTISTVHKAKGREWDTVRIAGDFRGPVTDPETGDTTWPSPEERRLAYVAATRAQGLLETGSLAWIYDYPQADGRDDRATQHPPSQELPATTNPRPAATPQSSPAPGTSTTATAGRPAPVPGQQATGRAAAVGGPQKPRGGTPDDAPAAGNAKADEVVAAGRRRAEARSRAHVPIDYARANAMIRRQRAALTRAVNSGDPAKVILAAQKAVSEWNQPGIAWPDDWSRWQRALDDVLPWNQGILLEDLADTPALDGGTPPPGSTAGQHLGASADAVTGTARREPAAPGGPEPPPGPVTNSDLATALHRLRGWDFARLVSGAGAPDSAGSRISRQDSEPDAGAHEALDWDNSGIDITISAPGIRRHGHLPWPQVASWIDAGMTPARLGLITTASRLHSFCRSARDKLIAAGKCAPDAAAAELAQIRDDTISMVITAALSSRGAAAPVPPARPGQPAYHTAAMITRPDPAAGKTENTALERLAQLRAAIQEPQPVTAAEVRTAIKLWIGDGLPDYVRALGESAAMRAWISRQVATRASRPAQMTYETPGIPGGRWYGASPEGLLTARGNDDRAETLIPWEEIPAWVQPGITTSLRDRLLTADDSHRAVIRRRLTAAAHPQASPTWPGDQEDDDQADRLRREAISAAWAAIEAAHPPAPAQLEHARRTYRDAGPAQETLFASLEPARQQDKAKDTADGPAAPRQPPAPAEPSPAAQPSDTPTAPATATDGSTPAEPGRQHDMPSPARAPVAAGGAARGQQPAPAARPQPGSTGTPLTADDIVLGLGRLPALVFADLIAIMDSGQPMDSVSRQLAPYSAERAASEPDAGARETVTPSPGGLRIQVTAVSGTRAGQLSWAEVADWLRPGLPPGRRQIVLQATRTRLSFAAANASFRAVGEASLAAGAERELRTLAATAVSAVLDAARAARTGQPRPGGRPSQPADDEAAALERIADLAAAVPARLPQPRTPVSHVKAGDIVGHPGYKLQPFRISVPPRHHDDRIEITGRLTEPSEGEPAGQITFTLPRTRQQDPVVLVVPVPARSLRAPLPETTASRGITKDRPHGSDTGPGEDAKPAPGSGHEQPVGTPPRQHGPVAGTTANGTPAQGTAPSAATPAPDGVTRTSQPADTPTPRQEDTMPPTPAATPPGPAAAPAPTAAPGTVPGPVPAANQAAGPRGSGSETRRADPPAGQGDEARFLQELDHMLAAIIEHRRAAAPQTRAGDDFADIRAAFTTLRKALDPAAPASQGTGHSSRPAAAVPDPAEPARAAPAAAHDGHADGTGDFDDIRAAFADLRHVLELPAHGRHAHGTSPHPAEPADPAASRLLDQAAAEAQACARWYRDTPEWQRITKIGRATRELIGAIREASGDYWAEIRQDIRARGFARTLAARVSLAVSGAAHILASRLERAGHLDTRAWRAAWGMHRATATFADRIMRYSPPGQRPGRMNDVRRIIDDLDGRPRSSREPAASPASSARRRPPATPAAVTLANTSFPKPVSEATIRPPSGSARPAASPVSHRHAAHRP